MERSVFDEDNLASFGHNSQASLGESAQDTVSAFEHPSSRSVNTLAASTAWLGAMPMDVSTPSGALGRLAETAPDLPVGGDLKRLIDLAGAILAGLVLSPLVIVIALAIRLGGGGPVFYAQTRIGFRGVPFRCLKFRTMRTDGDAILARLLQSDPAAAREWSASRKLRRDPRVTPLGRLLRLTSLDELPQLINVARGEMSLVGPRPVVADELARYGILQSVYLRARPGLTGLWQVSGRTRLSYEARVALDRTYVQQWSLAADLRIMLATVPAVLRLNEAA